ncbi:MAG: guanylate kinase [Deltaproteobacteria bacterium]
MREGILFVISGPSGSGKTTLAKQVVPKLGNLKFSVSCTTRPPRAGEIDGVDYRFVSEGEFDSMAQNGEFAEWAYVHGNRYGTPLEELRKSVSLGVDLALDIDAQGAKALRDRFTGGVYIFISPPTMTVLEERLTSRKTDSPLVIIQRLENAKREMREVKFYDYIIINDALGEALADLESVIRAKRCRTHRVIKRLTEGFWK